MKNINLLSLTKTIVSIKSDVSDKSNEAELAEYITRYLSKIPGLEVEKQNVTKDRCNIVAVKGNPDIFLLGHMDTVPVSRDEQLKPKISSGRIYGRGPVDMKAGLAQMLLLAKCLDNIGLIFTVDEEYQFLGMKKLITDFKYRPKLIINLEPTDLDIVTGCRGICEFELEARGKSAHSSIKFEGINAIEKTIEFCSSLEKNLRKKDTFGITTLNLAFLNGGSFIDGKIVSVGNVVPDRVKALVEIRFGYEGVIWKELKEEILKVCEEQKININNTKLNFLLGSMNSKGKYLSEFEKELKENRKKIGYKDVNRTGYFEAQMLQELCKCECIVFGPGPSTQAHKIDEYVDIKELDLSYKILLKFLKRNTDTKD